LRPKFEEQKQIITQQYQQIQNLSGNLMVIQDICNRLSDENNVLKDNQAQLEQTA
jgi:hypothetical protein